MCSFANLYGFDSAHTNAQINALSTCQVRNIVSESHKIVIVGPISVQVPPKLFMIDSLSVLESNTVHINYAPNVVQF